MDLAPGVYESLHTRRLQRALSAVPDATPLFGDIDPADAPEVLARHVGDAVRHTIAGVRVMSRFR